MARIGNPTHLSGAVKPDAISVDSYEPALFAKRVTSIPTNMQLLLAYNASGDIEYIGQGAKGLAEGAQGWLLWRLTWSSGNLVSRRTAYGTWSGRATATYD